MANVVEIVLKAVDRTKSGFTSPIKNLTDLGGALDKVKPAFLTLAATAGAAFGVMAKHAVDLNDEMGKSAQKAGTSVEKFSALAYAAQLSNVSTEALTKGFKELSSSMVAATKSGTEQEALFQSLGVSVRDSSGNMRDANSVLLDVATRFADTADGVEKTNAAAKLFGKTGLELIPLLNQGASGINAMTKEAGEFGQVVSKEAAASSEEFKDNLTKLGAMMQGVVNGVVAEFIPTLADLSKQFVEWNKQTGFVQAATGTLVDVVKVLVYYVKAAANTVKALWEIFKGFAAGLVHQFDAVMDILRAFAQGLKDIGSISKAVFTGHWSDASTLAQSALTKLQGNFSKFKDDVLKIGEDTAGGFIKALATLAQGPVAPTIGQYNSTTNVSAYRRPPDVKPQSPVAGFDENAENSDLYLKQLQKIADMTTQLHTEGLRGIAAEVAAEDQRFQKQLEQINELYATEEKFYAMTEEAEANHAQRKIEIQQNYFDQVKAMMKEMEINTASGTEAMRLSEDQRYSDRLKQIGSLNISEEQSLQLALAAKQEHAAKTKGIFREELVAVSGAFGGMADAAKAFGKKGFAAAKAFAIAQATIDTFVAAQGAYASLSKIPIVGPALGIAAAAAAVAAGFARVASIKSTDPGVAHAGLTSVPEEATYILNRGERVLAPEQNQDLTKFLNGGGGFGGPTEITINLDGQVLAKGIGTMSRDGRLEISTRAII